MSIELSYLTNCKETGIYSLNPKMIKVSGTIFDNEPGYSTCKCGIKICFKADTSITTQNLRKILIEENKINYCQDKGILIGPLAKNTFIDSFSAIKLLKNKVINNEMGLSINNISVQEIEIA